MRKILLLLLGVSILLSGCEQLNIVSTPTISEQPLLLITGDPARLPVGVVEGLVVDGNDQPIAGAVVRLQTTETAVLSKEDGSFHFDEIDLTELASFTAWQEGYFINNAIASAEEQSIRIVLHEIPKTDNVHYSWLSSFDTEGEGENQGCAECHSATKDEPFPFLPVDEWLLDAHSQSAVNPRFLTVYNGTDLSGNKSPKTVFVPASTYSRNSSNYSYVAMPPDQTKPYYGPGYKTDFPDSAGNCAACHAPLGAAKPGMGFAIDPNELEGVNLEGISCDLCHKVWDVNLDPKTDLPAPNAPGVLSFEFRRPEEGHQFFAGPFDDVAPGEDTYTPVQNESAYCASCHFGVFWEGVIYNSYGEWLESRYSDPVSGQTCQDCHMPRRGAEYFALASVGGLLRDPSTIFSHLMPGAMDMELLENAVALQADAVSSSEGLEVRVAITNHNTGHKIPTDYPGRQLFLIVQAFNEEGQKLPLIEGPVMPGWAGEGDPNEGNFSGLPGVGYALILKEEWTGKSPTIAYWNPFEVLSDNRISPDEVVSSKFVFSNSYSGKPVIKIQLIFRRNFKDVMDWKQWDTPDIIIQEMEINPDN